MYKKYIKDIIPIRYKDFGSINNGVSTNARSYHLLCRKRGYEYSLITSKENKGIIDAISKCYNIKEVRCFWGLCYEYKITNK